MDLFGPVSAVTGGGISNAGRPRLPTRLMVALLYLKHAFNESDEDVIQRRGAFAKPWAKKAWKNCAPAPWRWPLPLSMSKLSKAPS